MADCKKYRPKIRSQLEWEISSSLYFVMDPSISLLVALFLPTVATSSLPLSPSATRMRPAGAAVAVEGAVDTDYRERWPLPFLASRRHCILLVS